MSAHLTGADLPTPFGLSAVEGHAPTVAVLRLRSAQTAGVGVAHASTSLSTNGVWGGILA